MVSKYELSVINVSKLSNRTVSLKIEKPEDFEFVAGQFVMLSVLGHASKTGVTIVKAFSIASGQKSDHMEFCVVVVDGGMLSPKLSELKPGDKVTITGPYGTFNLKEPVPENTCFIAGGTGIAPLISMLRSLYAQNYDKPLKLFYGFRHPDDYLYREELESYAKDKKLTLITSISRESEDWTGLKGYINTFLKDNVDSTDSPVYICGVPNMVADTVKDLKEFGFKDEQIQKEQW